MTAWARIDVGFLRHPKLIGLKSDAKIAHLTAILHASEFRTDGVISQAVARTIAPPRTCAELVAAGLWHAYGDGYLIHGYLDHQPSRAEIDAAAERQQRHREQARERQARHRGQP